MPDLEGALERNFTLSGEWWHPHTPARKVYGTVNYSPASSPTVELHGDIGPRPLTWHDPIDSILGVTTGGGRVTLLRSRPSTIVWASNRRVQTLSLLPELIVHGKHVPSSARMKVESATVRYLHLEKWTNQNPFKHGAAELSEEIFARDFAISSLKGTLRIENHLVERAEPCLYLEQNQLASISLNSPEQLWFDWYVPRLAHLQRLLSLLIQSPVRARSMRVRFPGRRGTEAQLYYGLPEGRFKERLPYVEIALNLPMVEQVLPRILETWFEREDVFRLPSELYMASLHRVGSLDVPFLDLIRAIEVLHRSVYGGTYLPPDEFDRQLPNLLANA